MQKKLTKRERKVEILNMLEEQGSVEVTVLSQLFSVSEMSVRNDLNELANEGKLLRKHGGAYSKTSITQNNEIPLTEKQKKNFKEKDIIGQAAVSLIKDGDSIMLDAGTTTEHIAQHLNTTNDLTVITNGVNTMNLLLHYPGITTYTVGGKMDSKSFSIVGEMAEKDLKNYIAKISFISADGLTIAHGLTNNSHEATNISRILISNSQQCILVLDADKIDEPGIISLCPITDIDILLTDARAPESFIKQVEKMGVKVLIAEDILADKA
ncbi:MAG: DeoR/GlpR transcriptional regulator [Spirochaetales bacterium]|nr:DeoR/GlpR transcriptional regulator [Spirochaetales bacterium]